MSSLELCDTHCHLVLLEERGLLDAALESAHATGVTEIVTVGLDVADSDRNRLLAERLDGVWFTVGWHPHSPAPPDAGELRALDELLGHPRAVAVGEVGLDYYWRHGYHEVPADVQQRSLRSMLELAASHRKPVVVHDRDAHADVVAALRAGLGPAPAPGRPRGVLHCFSGDETLAAAAGELAMVCSFAGTVTFPRAEAIRSVAARLPPGRLVVETDAPFLAPVPHRGRPNLPGYVADTARAVAALRGEADDAFARHTLATSRQLFGLREAADRTPARPSGPG